MADETLKERMENLNRFLENYREKFHLDKIKVVDVDLSATVGEIKKMHPEDISQCILNWGLYSFSIQLRINELRAKLLWVEDNYNKYTGIEQRTVSREYGFTAYDRKMLLLESDNYAEKLYDLKTNIGVELAQLEYCPNSVNFLIKIAQQIADNKWKDMNSNRRN